MVHPHEYALPGPATPRRSESSKVFPSAPCRKGDRADLLDGLPTSRPNGFSDRSAFIIVFVKEQVNSCG
jgi:hypothetical protein